MAEIWSVAFMVNVGDNFEQRYQTAVQATNIPQDCTSDLNRAHALANQHVNAYGFQAPYSVYLNGSHNYSTTPAVSVTVLVQSELV